MIHSSIYELLKALVEHPKAPELFAVFLGFIAVFIGYLLKLRLTKTNTVFKRYEKLIRQLRTEKAALVARKQQLIESLEECEDNLNKLEAGKELAYGELEDCRKALEKARDEL